VTPPHTSTTALAQEVAVIGSGPSGLAAVFRLEQAGYRVRVFESGAKLGRRMRTFERDGFLIEEGATQIAKSYSSILGILHSAGLSSELLPASSQLGMLDPAGKTHNFEVERIHWDMAMTDIISRSKLMLGKLVIEAVKYRKELDKSDLSKLTALDGMSAELYGRQLVGEAHVTRWPYSWMQSYPGYWTAMRGFRKAGSGDTRIQLAGDYFCTSTSTPPAPRVSGPLATFSPTSSHLTQHRKERTRLCRRRSSFPASELPSPRSPSSSG
jgi:hypothetical protein